jgi:transcription elongation GreA/GreB family factor
MSFNKYGSNRGKPYLSKYQSKLIRVGSKVRILFQDSMEEQEFEILKLHRSEKLISMGGAYYAGGYRSVLTNSAGKGQISNESALGKALLGHKEGDTLNVVAPGGGYTVKVLEVKNNGPHR